MLYVVTSEDGNLAVSGRWLTRRSDNVWIDYDPHCLGPAGCAIMDDDTANKVVDMVGGVKKQMREST